MQKAISKLLGLFASRFVPTVALCAFAKTTRPWRGALMTCTVACLLIRAWSLTDAAELALRTVEAIGLGQTRREAMQAALVEAISKVRGAALDVAVATRLSSLEEVGGKGSSFTSNEFYVAEVRKITKGVISGWEVIHESNEHGEVRLVLAVTVADITDAGQHASRKVLAVLPFRVSADASIAGRSVPGNVLGERYRETLVSYLVASRKFAIVDETFHNEVGSVVARALENDDALRAAIRRANELAAEYLVTGICDDFGIIDEAVTVGRLSATIRKCVGVARVRVIQVENRQTVLAADFPLRSIPGLRLQGSEPENCVIDAVGKRMADRILDTIYPIRVISINQNSEVVMDRGGEGVKPGEVYNVYRTGAALTDPRTGESLGLQETMVGTIELVRALPKTSYAKILKASGDIVENCICRRVDVSGATIRNNTSGKLLSSPVDDLFR